MVAEPALVGIAAAFDQLFQAPPIAFQLVQAALVGFEVAGIAGQDETARAGFDVLQGGEDGLDRGDDLQAMADGPIGLQQRFLGSLALPAKGGEQRERSQKCD